MTPRQVVTWTGCWAAAVLVVLFSVRFAGASDELLVGIGTAISVATTVLVVWRMLGAEPPASQRRDAARDAAPRHDPSAPPVG